MFVSCAAGFAAMRQPDAPADGWYLVWLGDDGNEHRAELLTGKRYLARDRDLPAEFNASVVELVGVYHDDYFPRTGE